MTSYQNKKPTSALILAAGFGKRLLPLTKATPKSMVEVGGVKMLDRVIEQVKKCGIEKIYVNTHHLADVIKEHLAMRQDVNIIISHEPEILETGGGVQKVMQENNLQELLVVSSDNLMPDNNNAIEQVLDEWDSQKMDFLVALKNKKNVQTYLGKGDYSIDQNSKLSLDDPKNYIFVGAYIIKAKLFENFKPGNFRIPDVINSYLKNSQHAIYATKYEGDWFDIGTPENLEIANDYCRALKS